MKVWCGMNDINALLKEVIRDARTLKIPVSRLIAPEVVINTRAKMRFGCCRKKGLGWVIEISDRLLDADEKIVRETLAHEILHTCHGCQNHQRKWKDYAAMMNEAYGYEIKRTGKAEDMGVTPEKIARYALKCEKCGLILTRTRRSKVINHPERYRCKCGGRLFEIRPPTGEK